MVKLFRTVTKFENLNVDGMTIFIILLCLLLLSVGSIMNISASIDFGLYKFGDNFYFFKRQLFYLFFTISVSFFVIKIPMKFWYRVSPIFLLVCIFFLFIVLIPNIGLKSNGARRWITLGFITLQVGEFAKVGFCLYLSGYLVRQRKNLTNFWGGLTKPLIILSILSILLLLQPDYGSVVILTIVMIGLLYFANIKIRYFFIFTLVTFVTLVLLVFQVPYRFKRIELLLDPWSDQFDTGYQLTQSFIAIGEGHWVGTGLGESTQKLFFLPEAHTDFIFAIIAEELGFIGAFSLFILLVLLVLLILHLGNRIQKNADLYYEKKDIKEKSDMAMFCALICFSAFILLGSQVFINIAMTLGLLPTKGLTLPFISYGGSSLLSLGILISFVIRSSMEFNNYESKT